MNKQLIGIFRLILFFVIIFAIDVPFNGHEFKIWVSDFIHGGDHTEVMRNTTSVYIAMFVLLGVMVFYLFQTILYIFIGNALQDRNTSIANFFRHLYRGLVEMGNDTHFWTSGSSGSNLSNVDRVLKYRDNKMAMMSNKEASEFMKGTGHIDMMISRPDLPQSKKTLSYLNNKMVMMDNKTALDFLKGGDKG